MRTISVLNKRWGRSVWAASPPINDRDISRSPTRHIDDTACRSGLQGINLFRKGLPVEETRELSLLSRWAMGSWMGEDLSGGRIGTGVGSPLSLSWL